MASLSQGRTSAAQCGLFTHKSVPVIFETPCICTENIRHYTYNEASCCEIDVTTVNQPRNIQAYALSVPPRMGCITGSVPSLSYWDSQNEAYNRFITSRDRSSHFLCYLPTNELHRVEASNFCLKKCKFIADPSGRAV